LGDLAMPTDNPKQVETNYYGGLLAAIGGNEKSWSWDWTYNPNLKDHMHALGVIAANSNELEGIFYRIFFLTLGKIAVGKIVFSKLNNAERIETALKMAEYETAEFRDRYEHFISGYRISTENRNNLLHSKAHNAWPRDISVSHLTLAKPSKKSPDENNFISLDISELRSVSDDIAALASFGSGLFYWRYAFLSGGMITWESGETATPPLPEKPPVPRRLILAPLSDHIAAPPQPKPSGE
jgi:hypothetical protein